MIEVVCPTCRGAGLQYGGAALPWPCWTCGGTDEHPQGTGRIRISERRRRERRQGYEPDATRALNEKVQHHLDAHPDCDGGG